MISISGSTSLWTEIEVRDHDGAIVFDGVLEREPDWFVLKRKSRGIFDDVVKRWSGRRDHVDVLGDALKFIAKNGSPS